MKVCSLSLAMMLASLALTGAAHAALTVVSGNVYDVGKYSYSSLPTDRRPYQDSLMCWAAATSNIIQYWQDAYGKTGVPSGGQGQSYAPPSGTGCLEVYNTFLQCWSNSSGYAYNGISWWMQGGMYDPNSYSKLQKEDIGGYYKDIFGDTPPAWEKSGLVSGTSFHDYYLCEAREEQHYTRPSLSVTKTELDRAFAVQGQAVVLGILSEKTGYSHAISCWGYETDAEGRLCSLLVSDSDDEKYGLTLLNLREGTGADGRVRTYISTDRFNGFSEATECYINQITFIDTPEGTAAEPRENRELTAQDIVDVIDASSQIKTAVQVDHAVAIQGAAMNVQSGVPNAIVFTSAEGAMLEIAGGAAASSSPLLHVADGSMALLYGGLKITRGAGGGVLADGHLYIHGGEVDIQNRTAQDSGGAIYASQIDGTLLSAQTYAEIKGAGDVTLSGNSSTTNKKDNYYIYEAGGGALAAEDSFAIRDSGKVTMNNNSATGVDVNGGAAWAVFRAACSGNGDTTMTGNTLTGTGVRSYGGALAGYFVEMNGNGDLDLSRNSISLTNNGGSRHWEGVQYLYGARAGGGALAARFFTIHSVYNMATQTSDYTHASLQVNGNGSVTFNGNRVAATYTGSASGDETCQAYGGAVYLDGMLHSSAGELGTDASISRNKGDVSFTGNSVESSSRRGDDTARGGAVYIGVGSRLDMHENAGSLVMSGNSASGTVAQGGAVYNAGTLDMRGNGSIAFSGNRAAEGNDIYNAEGAVCNISGNGSVLFESSATPKGTAFPTAVQNEGMLYISAPSDHTVEFRDTALTTAGEGKTYIGMDPSEPAADTAGSVVFTSTAGPQTTVSARDLGVRAIVQNVVLSAGLILNAGDSGLGELDNTAVNALGTLTMQNVGLNSTDSVTAAGADYITMENVVVTLTSDDLMADKRTFNLTGLFRGNYSFNDITFELLDESLPDVDFNALAFDLSNAYAEKDAMEVYIKRGESRQQIANVGQVILAESPWIVPEPGTGALVLLGLAGLALRRRK